MDMSDVRIYEASDAAPRPALQSIARGFGGACPSCGLGRLFHRFLKVSDNCPECGEAFHHHQADDAPPYFTIMIVGHIVVPMMLWLELNHLPPLWVHAILWPRPDARALALVPAAPQGRHRRLAMGAAHARLRRRAGARPARPLTPRHPCISPPCWTFHRVSGHPVPNTQSR